MDKHGHAGERDKYKKKKREKIYVKKKNIEYEPIFMFPPPLINPLTLPLPLKHLLPFRQPLFFFSFFFFHSLGLVVN